MLTFELPWPPFCRNKRFLRTTKTVVSDKQSQKNRSGRRTQPPFCRNKHFSGRGPQKRRKIMLTFELPWKMKRKRNSQKHCKTSRFREKQGQKVPTKLAKFDLIFDKKTLKTSKLLKSHFQVFEVLFLAMLLMFPFFVLFLSLLFLFIFLFVFFFFPFSSASLT